MGKMHVDFGEATVAEQAGTVVDLHGVSGLGPKICICVQPSAVTVQNCVLRGVGYFTPLLSHN